ncbi:unnamed protein product [Hymenolepis diminuta]|uniref:X-box-binding protein 1 n=1 Tax=Hymenolepis diminuta TaxID=6216 RepID=A0A0R3S945_HYMDI|nr:unnamed protein product [Hymenolepis diminuta]
MSVVRCHFFDDCGSSVSTKASVRRRANLSHLSTVEKDARRKRLNRIAAQKARERNKVRNKQLEERVRFLEHENFQIRRSCDFYKSECEVKNKMIEKLRGEISKFEELQLGGYMQGKSIESAVLPQLKGLTTCIRGYTYYTASYYDDSSYFNADGEFADIGSEVTVSSSPSQENPVSEEIYSVVDPVCYDEDFKSFLDKLEPPDYPLSPTSSSILVEVVNDFLLSGIY